MTPTVHIRRNADGVVRSYADRHWRSPFIWEDGNYSCDCNRAIFFDRAGGAEDKDIMDYACGDGAYSVRITDPSGPGVVLYSDGEWPP